MLTFHQLGNYGRLGNQMFQYASTVGLAHMSNQQAVFPGPDMFYHYDLVDCFNIPFHTITYTNPSFIKHLYEEQDFKFKKELKNLPPNTSLQGYFQSEKYFLCVEDVIRKHFTFKTEIYEQAETTYQSLIENKESVIVSIHVRRTDYKDIQDVLPVVPLSYYEETMLCMRDRLDNPVFLVFSDDMGWCLNNITGDDVLHSVDNSAAVDMCMMTMCDHHIIANSSFSWWGAWLKNGDDQIIYAPMPWFGPRGFQDTQDLIPDHWAMVNYKEQK